MQRKASDLYIYPKNDNLSKFARILVQGWDFVNLNKVHFNPSDSVWLVRESRQIGMLTIASLSHDLYQTHYENTPYQLRRYDHVGTNRRPLMVQYRYYLSEDGWKNLPGNVGNQVFDQRVRKANDSMIKRFIHGDTGQELDDLIERLQKEGFNIDLCLSPEKMRVCSNAQYLTYPHVSSDKHHLILFQQDSESSSEDEFKESKLLKKL